MIKTPLKILAINPGWRYLGIAVFCDCELMEWRLKDIRGKGLKRKWQKVMKIISDFIDWYDPEILAIKKLHPSRSSENLQALAARIRSFCRAKKLKIRSYPLKDLEKFFSPDEKVNKTHLAEILISEYPALASEFKKEQKNKSPYFIRLFEAVALGAACYHQNKDKF